MMYTAAPQTIRIICKGGFHQQHIAVKSHQQLNFGKACQVSTAKFESRFDISVDDEIQRWPTIWNLSDILFGVNAATLHDVMKKLDMIDSRPMPIRDLKKMIWMDTHNKINLGISTLLVVISILISVFVIFIIYRAYKLKQESVFNHMRSA